MSLTNLQIIIAVPIALYVATALLLYSMQAHLLYHPDTPSRAISATPDAYGMSFEDVLLETTDHIRLHGWFIPARSRARAVMLFFHGNAGNISHRLDSIKVFHDLQLDIFIIDYRGYGQSEGKPSEKGTYLDAQAAWDYLVKQRNIGPQKIVIFGRSLGSSIAANLASNHSPAALIMESGFTSVPDLAAELYPFFPVRWFTRFKYRSKNNVSNTTCPVLIIHSTEDEIIPFHHGRNLLKAANEPKSFLQIRGGHNDGFAETGKLYIDGIDGFMRKYLR